MWGKLLHEENFVLLTFLINLLFSDPLFNPVYLVKSFLIVLMTSFTYIYVFCGDQNGFDLL